MIITPLIQTNKDVIAPYFTLQVSGSTSARKPKSAGGIVTAPASVDTGGDLSDAHQGRQNPSQQYYNKNGYQKPTTEQRLLGLA